MRNISKSKVLFLLKNIMFFALSKGVAFIAPLLLVSIIPIESYGEIEFAYSTGQIVTVILSLGLGGAYPYFILKKGDKSKEQAIYLFGVLILLFQIICSLLFYSNAINYQIYSVLLFSNMFSLQRLYSSILKTNEKGYLGVLYDGGYYFLLSVVMVIYYTLKYEQLSLLLRTGMELYIIGLSLLFRKHFLRTKSESVKFILTKQYLVILKYSVHLIISSVVVYWLTSSARIYIKYIWDYEMVGIYSFYFRIAGIAVVIYLFAYISFFKSLYISNPNKLDKYFFIIITVVAVACGVTYFASPFLVDMLMNKSIDSQYNKMMQLLMTQMPIWCAIALNEGIIARENLVKYSNIGLVLLNSIFLLIIIAVKKHITIDQFVYFNVLLFYISYLLQTLILRKKEIKLNKTVAVVSLLTLIATVIYFVN